MPTNATRTQKTPAPNPAVHAPLATESESSRVAALSPEAARKPKAYGLPCAKCRLYYAADLDACPTCHHPERVAPVVPSLPPKVTKTAVETIPDGSVVEQEREEFLRQFKSQLMEAHSVVANGAESACTMAEHHLGEQAKAEICKACYERLQERLDIFEGSLHIDLKEAAQIIYDAVWADPSDPNKTYQNAAAALLSELRKRAGASLPLSPFQPLAD
jgi:hypothetical protein